MAQTGRTPRREPPDPWSAIGLSRRAALGFLGAGAGFGIAAADKLWREGLPTGSPPEDLDPLHAAQDLPARTLPWALSVQYAPEERFVSDMSAFVMVALQHRGERRLLPGCRRLVELALAEHTTDPDAILSMALEVVRVLAATVWLPEIKRRTAPNADRYPRARQVLEAMLARSRR